MTSWSGPHWAKGRTQMKSMPHHILQVPPRRSDQHHQEANSKPTLKINPFKWCWGLSASCLQNTVLVSKNYSSSEPLLSGTPSHQFNQLQWRPSKTRSNPHSLPAPPPQVPPPPPSDFHTVPLPHPKDIRCHKNQAEPPSSSSEMSTGWRRTLNGRSPTVWWFC